MLAKMARQHTEKEVRRTAGRVADIDIDGFALELRRQPDGPRSESNVTHIFIVFLIATPSARLAGVMRA